MLSGIVALGCKAARVWCLPAGGSLSCAVPKLCQFPHLAASSLLAAHRHLPCLSTSPNMLSCKAPSLASLTFMLRPW